MASSPRFQLMSSVLGIKENAENISSQNDYILNSSSGEGKHFFFSLTLF